MNNVPLTTFERTIQEDHGARAKLLARENVREAFEGDPIWEGEVLVFELEGHPRASYCFAWEVGGVVTAVLAGGAVKSAAMAVRAAIAAEALKKDLRTDTRSPS